MQAHAETPIPSVAFKRQVAGEDRAGATLHGLALRWGPGHDLARNLIRIWVARYEAGAFDDDAKAADLPQASEARNAALERLVGRQALEREFLKGGRAQRTLGAKRAYIRDHRPRGLSGAAFSTTSTTAGGGTRPSAT